MKNYEDCPNLSIIVPVYNVAGFLEECIESITGQSYYNWELILVDDGSTDMSGTICDKYSANDKRIITIHKANGGLSSARNYGLDIVRGKYLTFVDSDDVILGSDTFEKLIKILEDDNSTDVVQYDVIFKYHSDRAYKRTYPFKTYCGQESILEGYLNQYIHVSCCDKIFKAEIFKDIRFPLHQISEDIAVIPNIIERINTLKVSDVGYYGYRYREGSISSSTLPYWKICSILNSYYKYLSFAMKFEKLKAMAILQFTKTVWNYLSIIRQQYPKNLDEFIELPIYIRVRFVDWMKLIKHIPSMKDKLRCFILCVCGVKQTIRIQNIFTHN